MDQVIRAQIDQDTFLAECEAKAKEAQEIAATASPEPWKPDVWYCSEGAGGWAAVGLHHTPTEDEIDEPGSACHVRAERDAEFIAHARTSNPDLADRVLRLVALVKERDQQIEDVRNDDREAASHREWAMERDE